MGKGCTLVALMMMGTLACHRDAPPPPAQPEAVAAPAPPSEKVAAPAAQAERAAAAPTSTALALGAASGRLAPLLGINMGPDPSGKGTVDLTKLYQDRGITLIRTHDFKGAFDLTSPTFDATDRVVQHIHAGGFGTYLRLGNSFGAGATTLGTQELVRSMVAMLEHVQGKKGPGVQYVEVWNEPDNREFWTQGDQAYFTLYLATARAVRARYPKVRIGGPALTPAGALTPRGRFFVERFLAAVKADGAPLDFVSWHMYSNDPAEFSKAAEFYRESAIKAGFGDIDQHVTEWNTSYKGAGETLPGGEERKKAKEEEEESREGKRGKAGGEGKHGKGKGRQGEFAAEGEARAAAKRDPQVRVGTKGSALATGAWIAMQQSGVDQTFFYRGPDPAPYPSAFFGMFYADGRPKPAGFAALLWKRMADHASRLSLTGPGTGPIWAVAGQSPAGTTAVLLANATDQAQPWTLACPAGTVTPIQTMHVRGTAEAVERGSQPDCSGTLDAWEVRYLEWGGR